jgi:hypothetical protein
MSIAKRIAAKRADQAREVVEVPEWGEGDDPLRLYFTPVTARDIEKIQRKHPNFLTNATMGAMVDMLIIKCEDENGDPAFTLEDKPILMGEPINVIASVFGKAFNATDVEEHEKN